MAPPSVVALMVPLLPHAQPESGEVKDIAPIQFDTPNELCSQSVPPFVVLQIEAGAPSQSIQPVFSSRKQYLVPPGADSS